MRIDIDLDDDRMVTSPGVKSPVTILTFKRDTSSEISIRFWSAGIQTELASLGTSEFGIKPVGEYDGNFLVYASTWAQTGTGQESVYTFSPEFNGLALANLLASGDGNAANDAVNITGMLEIAWTIGGKKHRTQTVTAVIENDVIKSTDSSPAVGPTIIGDTAPEFVAVFTARATVAVWSGIASSDDGIKLVACVYAGQIHTSTDSGATWTARETARNWLHVASDSAGTKLVACVIGGQIYTSTDSGATWTARDSARDWTSVATSADGTKLVACVFGGQIYTSTNSGSTWTARATARSWNDVASDSAGTKLVATVEDGQIYTSTDSGVTWTARATARNWHQVASSADGTKLVACVYGEQIHTSTDSGVTWTARATAEWWTSVASSADGTKLLAVVSGPVPAGAPRLIYRSNDSGVTWTPLDSDRAWNGICASADGKKACAVVAGGQIHTSAPTLTPPYIRTAGGFLYIQEAGVWKKVPLLDLA